MRNEPELVTILMSTYNGEAGLVRQIDSILAQSYKNIKLLIRDDGSSDRTIDIIKKYILLYPEKMAICFDKHGNLGSTMSFFQLLKSVLDNSYIMFADQDDFWYENKVSVFLKHIKKLESNHIFGKACLVFGDMTVVDDSLYEISPSFWKFQSINPEIIFNWKKALCQNVVTGCSMIINYKARLLIGKFPSIKMIHDHFIAINISKYGVVDYLPQQTMCYVQHDRNVVGASAFNFKYIGLRVKAIKKTWISYYQLCKYFEMNFVTFIYYKFTINIRRFFI